MMNKTVKKIINDASFMNELKTNLFEFVLKKYTFQKLDFINDEGYFHKITPELISALNHFDDGQNYDFLNKEIGKHVYISFRGEPIDIKTLLSLEHPDKENGGEFDELDIYLHTVQSLEVLMSHHHSEMLTDISNSVNDNELDDIVLYTILKTLDNI